jgi:hypothetical protein
MSSVTSSYAQKSGRSKFLIGVTSGRTTGDNTWLSALTFNSPLPTIPQSVIGRSAFNALAATYASVAVGDLFLDLGREIVVYDDENNTGSLHRNVFRECMRVNNANAEGNGGEVSIWVKVFSARGDYVAVARTG